ncbi:MAG: hypothetical protein ACEQSK_01870 [Sphingomonadaceae bacterium]
MSASNHTLSYHDYNSTSYTSNVIAAARALLQALFAVQPRQAAVVEQCSLEESRSLLTRLADDYERHSPNLSAELRFMASRG